MFALGLLLYVWARSEVHLEHILFGDVLGNTTPITVSCLMRLCSFT